MKILVTNDDGILSPVLTLLANALNREHEVLVVAPAADQSGMSHSFTHGADRRLTYKAEPSYPYPVFQVVGTPCDCVKFAVSHLYRGVEIDLVISGINLGENAGMSAVYSGTVAAAREGAMWGIPALAVSVWKNSPEHLQNAVDWLIKLLRRPDLLPLRPRSKAKTGGPVDIGPGPVWNINFPPCDPGSIEGVEVTSMSTVMFEDGYEAGVTHHGIPNFRLVGFKPPEKFREGTDDWALHRNRIAITPLQVDQSHDLEAARLTDMRSVWEAMYR